MTHTNKVKNILISDTKFCELQLILIYICFQKELWLDPICVWENYQRFISYKQIICNEYMIRSWFNISIICISSHLERDGQLFLQVEADSIFFFLGKLPQQDTIYIIVEDCSNIIVLIFNIGTIYFVAKKKKKKKTTFTIYFVVCL